MTSGSPGLATLHRAIYFCDDPVRLMRLERSELSRVTRAALVELCRREPRRNLRIAFLLLAWAAFGWLAVRTPWLPVRLACYLLAGCALVGCSVMMHDAVHSLLFRRRELNRWVGLLCGASVFVSFTAYRAMHLAHHRHTGKEHDPDDPERASVELSLPLGVFYGLYALCGAYPYLIHVWVEGFRLAGPRNRVRILAEAALIATALAAAASWLGLEGLARVWLIPWMVTALITSLRGVAEHGLTTGGNPFTDARTVVSNRVVSFVLCNVNYHLEHHLFTGVPWYHLPRAHRLLAGEYGRVGACVHPSYVAFYRDFLRCLRTGVRAGIRLVPGDTLNALGCGGPGRLERETR